MQRVGKRLNARRASPGMAFALAQRRNTAGGRFPARARALAIKGNHPLLGLRAFTGCSVPTRPEGATQRIQSGVAVLAKGTTAIPCGLRLVLNPLGRSASVIITWMEYE